MRTYRSLRLMGAETALVPLVDVVLLLLAFVIVSAGFLGRWWMGVDVQPAAQIGDRASEDPTVFVTAEGDIFLNGYRVDAEGLEFGMKLAAGGDRDPVAVVSVEDGVSFGELSRVLRMVQEAGVKRVALASSTGEEGR